MSNSLKKATIGGALFLSLLADCKGEDLRSEHLTRSRHGETYIAGEIQNLDWLDIYHRRETGDNSSIDYSLDRFEVISLKGIDGKLYNILRDIEDDKNIGIHTEKPGEEILVKCQPYAFGKGVAVDYLRNKGLNHGRRMPIVEDSRPMVIDPRKKREELKKGKEEWGNHYIPPISDKVLKDFYSEDFDCASNTYSVSKLK